MIAIIYYQEITLVGVISIVLSLLSVSTKSLIFSTATSFNIFYLIGYQLLLILLVYFVVYRLYFITILIIIQIQIQMVLLHNGDIFRYINQL